jgi:hypothetical protein
MSIMRAHVVDSGTDNRSVNGNQEQRSGPLKSPSKKSPDELRYLIVEFHRASPYFTSVEWELLDRARARLAQLEAEAAR